MSRRILPLSKWPEPDKLALEAAFSKRDIFERGPAAHFAPASRNTLINAYGRWTGFLNSCDPLALLNDPVARLTNDRLFRYLDHLSETVGSVGKCMYLAGLRLAIGVMYPGKAAPALDALVKRLKHEARPRAKAWVNSRRLSELGTKLMRGAVGKRGNIVRYIQYRDGLLIMLLAHRPLRRRTLADIRIGKQLRCVGNEWRLAFHGDDMKSGRPHESAVPTKVIPFLVRFLREVRPMFLGADENDALWISSKGHPLRPTSISRLIAARTQTAFGEPIPPHRFRHCAASTVAVLEPGQIQIASGLLDHASMSTTNKYYNLAQSIGASRLYAKILAELTPRKSCRRIRSNPYEPEFLDLFL